LFLIGLACFGLHRVAHGTWMGLVMGLVSLSSWQLFLAGVSTDFIDWPALFVARWLLRPWFGWKYTSSIATTVHVA